MESLDRPPPWRMRGGSAKPVGKARPETDLCKRPVANPFTDFAVRSRPWDKPNIRVITLRQDKIIGTVRHDISCKTVKKQLIRAMCVIPQVIFHTLFPANS